MKHMTELIPPLSRPIPDSRIHRGFAGSQEMSGRIRQYPGGLWKKTRRGWVIPYLYVCLNSIISCSTCLKKNTEP
ncbi:hypothetical protein ASZ90_011009 [hydrocarbon metagenome]|uniref:Uncharacterized protein n=1 Tax=hydrocarbon metagenome TaxID=938273 RepID=A0A0W8FEZ4_9ZZZZ